MPCTKHRHGEKISYDDDEESKHLLLPLEASADGGDQCISVHKGSHEYIRTMPHSRQTFSLKNLVISMIVGSLVGLVIFQLGIHLPPL